MTPESPALALRRARDILLESRTDPTAAYEAFRWPRFEHFNFAADWIDHVAAGERGHQAALVITEEDGSGERRTYRELAARSRQVAAWLDGIGVRRGDHVIVMLGNQVELWEVMLACFRLGAPVIPSTIMLGPADLADRVERGRASWVVTTGTEAPKFDEVPGDLQLVQVGPRPDGGGHRPAHDWQDSFAAPEDFRLAEPTRADETMLLYFTSGTTSKAKLVEHTHTSYPVGHLSTLYWIGLEPGDVHLNVASPGWAKHAWSNLFAPFLAEATVFLHNYGRFDAKALMRQMDREGVTSFCAPPTVWRMLIQADLGQLEHPPTKVVAAGEPLNPEVIAQVERAWGTQVRDGYGQTETTLQVANTPGQPVRPGAMGKPLPGYDVVLIDPDTDAETDGTGELCLRLDPRPVGLTPGYWGDEQRTAEAFRGGVYHTGDLVSRDADGTITYVGRTDDVFKASDYRLSPFELESAVIEHPAVAEAAVVPSPDPIRLAVPKAYVRLAEGWAPDEETARSILQHCRDTLAPYKRIRRLEFHELPKTVSGKIRRIELRRREEQVHPDGGAAPGISPSGPDGVEYTDDLLRQDAGAET
ncbi:AMP-dependent synthetase [Citricoccus sp. SGAir0253]|uniref:AMP-binding protein n=1 Tax=Citricoccus sp. SGAir0253 TaxID=2567881 RepID=UPI0010CD52BB|nr:AMP-binding protein [Citricoccus sp. SGAir0253]QCU78998.1 AMP-dependent synthetase [Citricoccus sp. SGAir0253]